MSVGVAIPVARRTRNDRLLWVACLGATTLAVAVLSALLIAVFLQGVSSLDWHFLSSYASRKAANAGILAPLMGSLWVCTLCGAISIPIGIATAIYLEEYAPKSRLRSFVQLNISNLSGVPSIVYGILGLAAFGRCFGALSSDEPFALGSPDSIFFIRLPLGRGILAGALTLSLVILPIMIIAAQEALRTVPKSLRQAALALGSTKWQVVRRVTLPAALPTMMTGAILSMSRAIGEAAPLLVIGGVLLLFSVPENLMSDFTVLPLQIYNWAGRPQEEFHRIAAGAIIVQLAVLLLFNSVAVLIRQKFQKPLQ
jgi:phosphate transport system permease protein